MILKFESDEIMVTLTCLVMAFGIGGWFVWLVLLAGPYLYVTTKRKYPRGFIKHVLYFLGMSQMKGYPSYHENIFIE